MIIHDSKIIFIHIPKTGGTTIERMLENNKDIGGNAKHFGAHHRLDQVFQKYAGEALREEERYDLGNYNIFTVARNPWERYASLYVHDKVAWESIPKNKKRTFIDIEEYISTRVAEHFFRAIEVNGSIPDNLLMINFDDFKNEVKRVFGAMGIKPGRIFHANKKKSVENTLVKKILKNEEFIRVVGVMCDKEIQLFSYELPSGNKE